MNSYVAVAVCSWLVLGIVFATGKRAVHSVPGRDLPPIAASPLAQTFYTGVFSIVIFFLFESFAPLTSGRHFCLDLACGIVFLAAQFCLYKSLAEGSALEILPVLASLTPALTLVFASVFLNLKMSNTQFNTFAVLIVCMVVVQFQRRKPGIQVWPMATALFSAAYYTLAKASLAPFVANLSYVSIGVFLGSTALLFSRHVRTSTRALLGSTGQTVPLLTVLRGVLAVAAVLALGYAVSTGNPAFVSVLQIVEYAAVFVLTSVFALNVKT